MSTFISSKHNPELTIVIAIARLEEEQTSLKDYVVKYETELSRHEGSIAQLSTDFQQVRFSSCMSLPWRIDQDSVA